MMINLTEDQFDGLIEACRACAEQPRGPDRPLCRDHDSDAFVVVDNAPLVRVDVGVSAVDAAFAERRPDPAEDPDTNALRVLIAAATTRRLGGGRAYRLYLTAAQACELLAGLERELELAESCTADEYPCAERRKLRRAIDRVGRATTTTTTERTA